MSGSTKWMKPDELIKIQRKLQKLQDRTINKPREKTVSPTTSFSNGFINQKRSNPFVKNSEQENKKSKSIPIASEDTIFEIFNAKPSARIGNIEAPTHEKLPSTIDNRQQAVIDDDDEEEVTEIIAEKRTKTLPIDWSIKSRVRILTKTQVVSNNLKSSEEASGMTGYVRCLDIKSTTSRLDISDGSRFHQNLMYWQFPNLPWLNLVQRNSTSNNNFKMNTLESDSLISDWKDSFRSLFHLVRALQCPYFYVLANHFTALFRAKGIGGRCEIHVLLTPTTRGFRKMLKEEDVEFSQPLKKASKDGAPTPNTSVNKTKENENHDIEGEEEEEEDEMKFLEGLGVETSDIKFKDDIKTLHKETEDDNGDLSTILIEGVDCQAFFTFLLSAKTTVNKVGRLAGVPPTLLAPVAFLGGTLKKQTVRNSKLRLENEDFHSIELRGAIMPHTVHTLCSFLSDIKPSYSLTMVNYPHTVALTKASSKLLEDLDSSQAAPAQVIFRELGRENLSDCGMDSNICESMCRVDLDAVNILERLQFDRESGGYTMF